MAETKETKEIKFEVKAFDDETMTFEGLASAYRTTPDAYGDIVEPGAYTKTIKDSGGEVILTFPPHDTSSPVGMGKIEDSDKGLKVTGKLVAGVRAADDAYLLLKAGVIKELSIGYAAIKKKYKDDGDKQVRHLQEIKLYEVALCPKGLAADDKAKIGSVKAAEEIDIRFAAMESRLAAAEAAIKSIAITPPADGGSTDKDPADDGASTGKSTEPGNHSGEEAAAKIDAITAEFVSGMSTKDASARIENLIKILGEKNG